MTSAINLPDSNDPGPNGNGWESCAPGTLGGLRSDLRSRHMRLITAQVAGGLTAAVIVIAVGLAAFPSGSPSRSQVALISCQRCIELMPPYHDHLVRVNEVVTISPDDIASVTHHLNSCRFCRQEFEEQYPGVLAASAAAAAGLALFGTRRLARPRLDRA